MLALGAGGRVDASAVRRMCDAQAHRGPDDSGLWESSDGQIVLGHRRLSIIDLSPSGHQPMHTRDGRLHIVFNGEIYNHVDLKAQCESRGHRFRTHTDTESILHLYEDHGEDCVSDLNGMFAFAIFDQRDRSVTIARDRLGIKPLY